MSEGGACSKCGKVFDNDDELIEHQLICDFKKNGRKCRFCGKVFFGDDELIEHELHCGDK